MHKAAAKCAFLHNVQLQIFGSRRAISRNKFESSCSLLDGEEMRRVAMMCGASDQTLSQPSPSVKPMPTIYRGEKRI